VTSADVRLSVGNKLRKRDEHLGSSWSAVDVKSVLPQ